MHTASTFGQRMDRPEERHITLEAITGEPTAAERFRDQLDVNSSYDAVERALPAIEVPALVRAQLAGNYGAVISAYEPVVSAAEQLLGRLIDKYGPIFQLPESVLTYEPQISTFGEDPMNLSASLGRLTTALAQLYDFLAEDANFSHDSAVRLQDAKKLLSRTRGTLANAIATSRRLAGEVVDALLMTDGSWLGG